MALRFGEYEIDVDAYELRCAGVPVAVEPQVFDVLAHLVRNRQRVVTKEELLDEVWGDRFVSESALSSRIMSARKAIGDDGRRQDLIRTVHGRGFRFVGAVEGGDEIGDEPTPEVPTERATRPALRVRPAPPRTRYAHSDGFSVAYQVLGEGPNDIVVVPGFVSNIELQWDFPPMADFYARLASFGRLILFDKRGTGLSERFPSDAAVPLEERMDDVRAVMDAAGSAHATLVGISEGGPMSVLFAATHPDRVERLVLVNAFAGSFREGATWAPEDIATWWGTGTVFEFLAPSLAGHAQDRAFFARYERNCATPAGAAATVAMNDAIDVRPVLSTITAPTLVLHRRGDEVVRPERGREIADAIPDARFVEVDGTDHLAFVDPAGILDEIEAFVTGSSPASPWDRVLTTVLFVDVVGSTSTAERLGDSRWRALLGRFYDTARGEVRHGRGEVVGTTGDGLLATFDGPARAIRCGLAMIDSVGRLGLTVRVGVHTGEVERLGDDLVGINVNVGARVADAARPGEVWVTRTVHDLVAGSGLHFEPRGEHDLKGVSGSRELYVVA